jgi:hypothetical protein
MENNKFLILIGDSGILSKSIIKVFKNSSSNWKICLIDYTENNEADKNILLSKTDTYSESSIKSIISGLENLNKSYDAIINVESGLVRGSIKNIEIFEQSKQMLSRNYFSALLGKEDHSQSWSFGV